MAFKTFSILIIIRTCLFIIALLVLTALLSFPGYHAATILTVVVLFYLGYDLIRFVTTTNQELTRFLEAARFADYSQRFHFSEQGSGFEELGATFTEILEKLRKERGENESRNRYLHSLIEQVPVPLLSIHPSGKITTWNVSARKLFAQHRVQSLDDFAQLGGDFLQQLKKLKPGERRLVSISIEGAEHRLSLSATELLTNGNIDMLVSLQDIQNELDFAQMQAWQDLVKVLTHEIMNSITPVASLAKTSVELLEDVKQKQAKAQNIDDEIEELFHGIDTVSRRSDSLIKFVSSYRKLTDIPKVQPSKVDISQLFSTAQTITSQSFPDQQTEITTLIEPTQLTIKADKDLIEQIMINLLKNAYQATQHNDGPQKVTLHAYINRRGRGVIEIQDNGSGIEDDVLDKIFVPFFTTKRDGSGVGLALARQVMIAHRGNISAKNLDSGGACFTLTF
ncbi:sensor histidine kinase [Aliiglaciecola sp. M165]|uniref:sensor histidine kinase n=1 Tax=Aliiglaciecola sp. M165 TaxID=2593649 RepID=UPI001180EB9F|nr:ATP-binding protein [Aliiglaciecola sp. M165]TRY31504.1 histidine kinase [Aliiglaciecola sp. M165]